MPVIPPSDFPMCLRRDMYLDAVAKDYQPTLEILIDSLTKANPDLSRYIHFPFWSIDSNAKLINWYIMYKPPKYHIWHQIKKFFDATDDLVAVNFDGSNVIIMSYKYRPKVFKVAFNLADPSSFTEIGKHLFRLLV